MSRVPDTCLSLDREQEWLLECLGDPAQESRGVRAINEPVIVRERHRQDLARLKFIVHPDRLDAGTRKPQDRDFRMIHNWREAGAADSAEIGDGESSAF